MKWKHPYSRFFFFFCSSKDEYILRRFSTKLLHTDVHKYIYKYVLKYECLQIPYTYTNCLRMIYVHPHQFMQRKFHTRLCVDQPRSGTIKNSSSSIGASILGFLKGPPDLAGLCEAALLLGWGAGSCGTSAAWSPRRPTSASHSSSPNSSASFCWEKLSQVVSEDAQSKCEWQKPKT